MKFFVFVFFLSSLLHLLLRYLDALASIAADPSCLPRPALSLTTYAKVGPEWSASHEFAELEKFEFCVEPLFEAVQGDTLWAIEVFTDQASLPSWT